MEVAELVGTENQTLASLILKLNPICPPRRDHFSIVKSLYLGRLWRQNRWSHSSTPALLGDSLLEKVLLREKATHYSAGLDHRNILSFVYCDQLNPLLLEPGLASILA